MEHHNKGLSLSWLVIVALLSLAPRLLWRYYSPCKFFLRLFFFMFKLKLQVGHNSSFGIFYI